MVGKQKTIINKLLEALRELVCQVKPSRESSLKGSPTLCEFYLRELYQALTLKTGEQFSHSVSRGREKGTFLKYIRAFYPS